MYAFGTTFLTFLICKMIAFAEGEGKGIRSYQKVFILGVYSWKSDLIKSVVENRRRIKKPVNEGEISYGVLQK